MTSKRFGKAFNSAQVRVHISEAVFKALEMLSAYPNGRVGIALPDTPIHRRLVRRIAPALNRLHIIQFWVGPELQVCSEGTPL
jgi:hypothetical protein